MFQPQAGSKAAKLVNDIDSTTNEIEVDDVSLLPDPPNILTIFDRDSFETIYYTSLDQTNNLIQDITRGVEGTAQDWPVDQEIARNFTARDLETVQTLLRELYYDSTFTISEGVILSFSTPTIDPNSMDVHAYYDSIDIDLTYNNAEEITEINIAGDSIIDPSYWNVDSNILTIDTEPLLTYELNNSISSFDINIVFNENFTTNTLSVNMIDDGYETDEGQILTETTLD